MKLSILIPSLNARKPMLDALLARLMPQVKQYESDVEVLIDADNGETPSGQKRNRLVRRSRGDYFAQLDDDDQIQKNYLASLMGGCETGADVVTFDMERLGKDRPREIHCFSIHFHDRQRFPWGGIGMQANHLCAWRRDIGTQVCFPSILGYNDDVFWYGPLCTSGLVKTEHRIEEILYTYHYSPTVTRNQLVHQIRLTREWSAGGVPCWLIGSKVYVAVMGQDHYRGLDAIQARDGAGTVYTFCRHAMPNPFFVARMK